MARKNKAEQATATSDGQVALPAGTGTQNEPLSFIPGQRERSDARTEEEEPVEDTLRLQKDKARWGDSNAATINEMLNDQKAVDEAVAEGE